MKQKSFKKLKKELDKVFSEYIRQRDKGICFTCGSKHPWKKTDAGHFIKRNHLITRWNEKNVNCQCWGCNRFRDGNKEIYAVNLESKYGFGILQELENLKNKGEIFVLTSIKLEETITLYKSKIKKLK